MRKIGIFFVLALMALFTAAEVQSLEYDTDHKAVRVKNTRYDPFPVEPGSYFTIWIRVENFGNSDLSNFKFRLVPKYPFSLDPNEEAVREFGVLGAGSQALFNYKVRADLNAVEGSNPLAYEFSHSGAFWNPGQFNVEIYTLDPILSIGNVEMDKERVAPGEEVNVKITLNNLADSALKDVNVKLNFISLEQTSTGISYNDLPISPIGSGDEKTIKIMEGGAEQEVEFSLIIDPSAEATVYKLPVTITYNDMQGRNYTKNTVISMVVGSEPDLAVNIDASTAHLPGKLGEVSIKFVNKGFSEIKFLYVTLEKNGGFDIVSPQEVYLGNVDSDDYETAEYTIYVNPDAEGDLVLPIRIEYKDTNNNDYSKQISLKTRIYSSKEAKMFGVSQGSGWTGIIVIAAIVICGLLAYRTIRRRKKARR